MAAFLVTRSDQGIGADLAAALAADGHRVMSASRTGTRPPALDPHDVLTSTAVDMRSIESIREAVLHTVELFGGIDGLILQTGVEWFSPVELMPDDLYAEVVDSQLVGTLRLLRAAIPHLRRSGRGRIIALSSLGARYGLPTQAGCCSVKAAIETMLESLRFEVEPFGTRISIIQGGYSVNTGGQVAGPSSPVRSMPTGSVYEPLLDLARINDCMRTGRVEARVVVELVRHLVQTEQPPFRTTIGSHAAMADGLRRGDDDDALEAFTALTGIEQWLAGTTS